MNNTSFYTFLRPGTGKNDTEQMVYIRVIIDRKKKDYSMKIRTLPKYWNKQKQEFKVGHLNFTEDNLKIAYYLTCLSKLKTDALFDERILTFQDYDLVFDGEVNQRTSFYSFVRQLVKDKTGKITQSTINLWNAEMNKMQELQQELLFTEINLAFLNRYDKFLRDEKHHKPITIHKAHRFLKARLNDAMMLDIIKENPYRKYPLGVAPDGNMERLTIAEVKILEEYLLKPIPDFQYKVLRYFLFACYTGGLRYSDIAALTYSSVIERKSIQLRVQKTGEMLYLDLPKKAIELLGEGQPNEKVFDVTTNQHTNRILKIIMGKENANINKNIHFHCARHTFATIALELGVAIATVQRIMAHQDIRTTLRYAKVVDASVKKGMMMIDEM